MKTTYWGHLTTAYPVSAPELTFTCFSSQETVERRTNKLEANGKRIRRRLSRGSRRSDCRTRVFRSSKVGECKVFSCVVCYFFD